MITVFKNIKDTKFPHLIEAHIVFRYIRDGRWKDKIEELRLLTDATAKGKMKGTLPSICWSGEFSRRANDAIDKHSGLVCIDFDHVPDMVAEDVHDRSLGLLHAGCSNRVKQPGGGGILARVRLLPNKRQEDRVLEQLV